MQKKEITIDGEIWVPRLDNTAIKDGKQAVLVRSYAAGVHFGYLEREEFTLSGKVVVLSQTRRVWSWSGAASLSQMAVEGVKNPSSCKVSVIVPSNEIVNVIETIPLSEMAFINLYNIPVWQA
jgi:hypothetical protein